MTNAITTVYTITYRTGLQSFWTMRGGFRRPLSKSTFDLLVAEGARVITEEDWRA